MAGSLRASPMGARVTSVSQGASLGSAVSLAMDTPLGPPSDGGLKHQGESLDILEESPRVRELHSRWLLLRQHRSNREENKERERTSRALSLAGIPASRAAAGRPAQPSWALEVGEPAGALDLRVNGCDSITGIAST
jgi:hypothetical protein